jgi:hypothetical protein
MTDLAASPHFSPLLQNLPERERPPILPDCSACPAGNWYREFSLEKTGQSRLVCWCEAMCREVYNSPARVIRGCDLRSSLILAFDQKKPK